MKAASSTLITLFVLALLIPFSTKLGHGDLYGGESWNVQASAQDGEAKPRIVSVSSPSYPFIASGVRAVRSVDMVSKTTTRLELNGIPVINNHIPVFLDDTFTLAAVFDNTSTDFGGPFNVFYAFIEFRLDGPISLLNVNFPPGATCQNSFPFFRCDFLSLPAGGTAQIEVELVALELTSGGDLPQITVAIGSDTFNPDPSQTTAFADLWIELPPVIHIRKFWDYNEDGVDLEEFGINDVVFELYLGTSLVDTQVSHSVDENLDEFIDPFTETGLVWFGDLFPGDYLIREILPEGFGTTTTFGTEYAFTVPLPPLQTLLPWGNIGPRDWGDLPDPRVGAVNPCPGGAGQCYPTLDANNGPSHLIIPFPFALGFLIDTEPDGQPDRLAEGDDINGVADEDGLERLVINNDGSVTMDVRMSDPLNFPRALDVWIDVNDDGYLDPATENVIVAALLAPNAVTTVTTAPLGYSVDDLLGYLRLRLSTFGGLPPTGPWFEGEVEDYVDYGIDRGDLPDPRVGAVVPCPRAGECYPTLKANSGPSHLFLRDAFVLGYQIDAEVDGQPSALATGDDASPTAPFVDYNPGADTNDEDGLVSVSIEENGSLTMIVRLTDPKNQQRFLDVWIDLNDDGYLAYAGDGSGLTPEDVFIGEPLDPGLNTINTGILNPPLKPDEGLGYMRLRLSSTGFLDPTGHFDDGEVEDYFEIALDYGDAPEELDPDHPDIPFGYPTTLTNNGARHAVSPNNKIGKEVDGESNGKPTTFADGDDNATKDDEDGVEFLSGFAQLSLVLTAGSEERTLVPGIIPGVNAEIVVFPSRSGKIDAWVDWNADGDNTDPDTPVDISYMFTSYQNPSPGEMLSGYADWPNLRYAMFGQDFADGVHNSTTEDTEMTVEIFNELDSIPPPVVCLADFDNSGDVGVKDLLFLLGAWGPCP
ncbi:MAG: hypothetical protein IH853_04155 [Bacteroidetes bacterium]|nr:hypothetical protein [Bacteroidota bacterium]